MLRVVIESPFAGNPEVNLTYLRGCLRDSLSHGEAPIASHGLYTQPGVLDDSIPEERAWGIAAGLEWYSVADKVIFYLDRGITDGMKEAVKRAVELRKPRVPRFLYMAQHNISTLKEFLELARYPD